MLPPRFLPAFLTPRFGRCLSLEMLRDGWAVTYEQAGAVYGKWGKEHFLELEAKAKLVVYPHFSLYFFSCILVYLYSYENRAARRGQWASGAPSESPAEYKRRHAAGAQAPKTEVVAANEKAAGRTSEKRGWLDWFKGK